MNPDMYCTSLRQPWATLIAAGFKKCETRSTPLFRNRIGERIGIASSKKPPDHDQVFGDFAIAPWRLGEYGDPNATFGWEISRHRDWPDRWDKVDADVPFGALVCTAVVENVVEMVEHDDLTIVEPHIVTNDRVCYYRDPQRKTVMDLSVERDLGFYEPGRFGIILADVRPVTPPTPISGAQGIWTLRSGLDRQAETERNQRDRLRLDR